MTVRFALLLAISTFFFSDRIFSASFDCSVAKHPMETTICGHSDLSLADEEMSEKYRLVMQKTNRSEFIVQQQKQWVGWMRWLCEQPTQNLCVTELRERYAERIKKLDEVLAENFDRSLEGTYHRHLSETPDCITIRSVTDKSLEFSVVTWGYSTHSCGASGTAIKKGSVYEYAERHDAGDIVTIVVTEEEIRITGGSNFCGVRAKLGGVFKRSNKVLTDACSREG